ncbi:related to sugar transport protein STP1 [Serendipita indica DSM 11827]|uniref:Related to sugar transport protein STP1 n=1 Tax=Serendipita indica (strain DSM 11827) TaxID=1109443 RepID=G4TQ57_SERID|nr:related to sugar transport protein STP1 [Serendipita indica DSM 11827]
MGFFFNFVVALFAALGSFLFVSRAISCSHIFNLDHSDSGIIGSVVSAEFDQFHSYFKQPNDDIIGAIVSTFAGGCFFGAAAAGWLATHIGRKRTIQTGALIGIFGCSLQTGARNVGFLIAGRFIAGLAIGCLSMIVPLYQSEISPPHMRGLLTGLTQWMIGLGFLVANWVGYGCQFLKNDGQWRIPLAIQIVPAVMLLLGMFVLPFSPRWLIAQGREEEAYAVVQKLHSNIKNEEFTKLEFAEMVEQIKYEKEHYQTRTFGQRRPWHVVRQLECWYKSAASSPESTFPRISNQLCTALLVSVVPKSFSLPVLNGALGTIVTGLFIAVILDRVGRKPPLIVGGIGMAICLAIEAAINAKWGGENANNRAAQQAGIAFIIIFGSLFFSTSFGPVSWVYQSEIFPMRIRALGTAVCTCANWATNVLISQVSPIGMSKLQYKFYILFVVTNICNVIIVAVLFPETKGKSLEEMDAVFGDQEIPHALETNKAHNLKESSSSQEEKGEYKQEERA